MVGTAIGPWPRQTPSVGAQPARPMDQAQTQPDDRVRVTETPHTGSGAGVVRCIRAARLVAEALETARVILETWIAFGISDPQDATGAPADSRRVQVRQGSFAAGARLRIVLGSRGNWLRVAACAGLRSVVKATMAVDFTIWDRKARFMNYHCPKSEEGLVTGEGAAASWPLL